LGIYRSAAKLSLKDNLQYAVVISLGRVGFGNTIQYRLFTAYINSKENKNFCKPEQYYNYL